MRRLAPLLLLLLACARSTIYGGPDDIEALVEKDAGTVVNPDRQPWFECDVETQDCDAGTGACFYAHLVDGGIGSKCFVGACDLVSQNCPAGQRCAYARADGGTS